MRKATCSSYCACWLEVGEIIACLTHHHQVWITKREIYMPQCTYEPKLPRFFALAARLPCVPTNLFLRASRKWEIEFYSEITWLDKEVWKIDLMRQRNLLDRLTRKNWWVSDLEIFLCCFNENLFVVGIFKEIYGSIILKVNFRSPSYLAELCAVHLEGNIDKNGRAYGNCHSSFLLLTSRTNYMIISPFDLLSIKVNCRRL